MQVDLNLLVALDALLEEGSVQGAADRLHLSAPAMSRTLTRIRRATGDDILVRTGRTMTPTPHALQLRDETHALVERARTVLTPARTLELATLTRVFSIRGHDALVAAVAPALTRSVATRAPHVALRFLSELTGDSADLARGQVDLEVGADQPGLPEIAYKTAGTDRLAAVFRAAHPLATGQVTAERFAAAAHVIVSRRARFRDALDDTLTDRGLSRRVVASLPTSAAALALAARVDVVCVVADRLCAPMVADLALRAAPLPFPMSDVPAVVAWHRRYDTDPAHAWLRTQVLDTLRSLLAPNLPEWGLVVAGRAAATTPVVTAVERDGDGPRHIDATD